MFVQLQIFVWAESCICPRHF